MVIRDDAIASILDGDVSEDDPSDMKLMPSRDYAVMIDALKRSKIILMYLSQKIPVSPAFVADVSVCVTQALKSVGEDLVDVPIEHADRRK